MKKYLEIRNLAKRFGGVVAVRDFSLKMDERTILGIIGPNGSGKTTLLNLVNGFLKADEGEIFYKGRYINNLSPHEIARMGVGRTFQITRIFRNLTVLEHLLAPWSTKKLSDLRKRALELTEFLDLTRVRDEKCKNLSGGQQRVLQFAAALMSDPELLLMDEPFYGIAPPLKRKICDSIQTLANKEGKNFIIISHDVPSIMNICERVIAMSSGELIADSPPRKIRRDKRVIESYLGM